MPLVTPPVRFRSIKCPICNQNYPQPHRIFLDLEALADAKNNSDTGACEVTIKGIPASQLKHPLSAVVLELARVMGVPISEDDIEHAFTHRKALQVNFKSSSKKDMFLKNKYKLKQNPSTSTVVVHEVLDPETNELFVYSHKLKDKGYKTFFVNNKKVFVKKEKTSNPIGILSKAQVDTLYTQSGDITSTQLRPSTTSTVARPTPPLFCSTTNVVTRKAPTSVTVRPRTLSNIQTYQSNPTNTSYSRSTSTSHVRYNYDWNAGEDPRPTYRTTYQSNNERQSDCVIL